MTDLTKRESFYFIVFALAALGVMISILAFWSGTQPKCWDQYSTEEQAIQVCEQ
jgi:dipeptide/tripeptide permease